MRGQRAVLLVQLGGVLQTEGLGHLAREREVADQPDDQDAEELQAGTTRLVLLDVRELLLDRRSAASIAAARSQREKAIFAVAEMLAGFPLELLVSGLAPPD
jgi:hypothetical protein